MLLLPVILFSGLLGIRPVCAEDQAAINYYIDGTEAYDSGDYESALMSLGKAIELDGSNLDYQYYFAMTYTALGRYQEAESIYKAILNIDPKNYYKACFDLAAIYTKKKEYKKALSTLGSAEWAVPNNARLYLEKGTICRKMKDYKAAIDNFNRALELDQKLSQTVNYNLALVYFSKKNYVTAENLFDMVIREAPDNSIAAYAKKGLESIRAARRAERPWTLFAYLNYSWDDNLPEDPLDLPGNVGGTASDQDGQYQVLFLKGDYRFLEVNRFTMLAGYQFSWINFNDSANENMVENSPFLMMKYDRKPWYFKLSYNFSHYFADSDDRQIQHRIKPSLTVLEPYNMRSQFKLMYKIKDYRSDAPSEDATVWTAEAIQHFSVPSLRMKPRIGLKYGDEDSDTETQSFSYIETMAAFAVSLPKGFEWDLSFTDIRSDYDTSLQGGNREDTGYEIETFVSKNLTRDLSTKLLYGYYHNKSNVIDNTYNYDPYKYEKNYVRLSFSMNF